jgi:pimeloyl-CoA synthetase
MSNQYIHISEAVKTYDKTRQTFYNYLHKGLVRSKKINNRTYLHIGDIKELLSEYIWWNSASEVDDETVEEIYDDLSSQKATIDSITTTVQNLEESINKDLNLKHHTLQQSVENTQSMVKSFQYTMESLLNRFSVYQQKSRFLVVSLLLIVVHIVIGFIVL